MSAPQERAHSGLLLQALYPLERKVPGLERVPLGVRRATRRTVTAAAVRAHLARCRRTTLVAITGSRGKTTLKDLLACMLAAAGPTVRTRQNDNDLYGVPATLLAIRPDDRFAVVEAGTTRPGEMAWIAGLMRPDVAVLTGIGDDHLAAFGSPDAIAEEKWRLLARARTVVAPVEHARAGALAVGAGGAFELEHAELDWPRGLVARVRTPSGTVAVHAALHGLHLAPLVALGLAAAHASGVAPEVAARGAAAFVPPPGRLRPEPGPGGSVLLCDDAKSREPTALAALAALKAIPAHRRVAALGELQERPAAPEAYATVARACEGLDRVVAVGAAARGLPDAEAVPGVTELAAVLAAEDRPGTAILLHGANAQHLLRAQLLLAGQPVGCRVGACRLRWRCTDCPHLATGPPPRLRA